MRVFYFLLPSLIASIIPYLACNFFDTPQLHGIISADIFFLLILFLLPYGKILYKMPFVIAASVFAIVSNSVDAYTTMGVYILMIFATAATPRKRIFLLPVYSFFALLYLIADAGNFFYSTFVLTLPDVWGLAKFYWWGPVLFIAIPLSIVSLQLFFARKILWEKEHKEISHLAGFAIISIVVGLNYGVNHLQQRQPIMDFAAQKWFWQLCTPGIIGQNPYLQEDIKAAFPFWQKGKTVLAIVQNQRLLFLSKAMVSTNPLLIQRLCFLRSQIQMRNS